MYAILIMSGVPSPLVATSGLRTPDNVRMHVGMYEKYFNLLQGY